MLKHHWYFGHVDILHLIAPLPNLRFPCKKRGNAKLVLLNRVLLLRTTHRGQFWLELEAFSGRPGPLFREQMLDTDKVPSDNNLLRGPENSKLTFARKKLIKNILLKMCSVVWATPDWWLLNAKIIFCVVVVAVVVISFVTFGIEIVASQRHTKTKDNC